MIYSARVSNMNFKRVGLAALAGWVTYMGLGFLVHGVVLDDLWRGLIREGLARSTTNANALLPLGMALGFPGVLAFTYAYAKGYEGGAGLQEGLRFGVLVGLMLVIFCITWNYIVFPLPSNYVTSVAIATIIQFAAIGMVVGIIYKR